MKILHFTKSDGHGGASRAAFRIHQSLVAAGLDSRMVVGNKVSDDERVVGPTGFLQRLNGEIASQLDQIPLRFTHLDNVRFRSSGFVGQRPVQRSSHLERDIVHLHWIAGGFMTPRDVVRLSDRPIIWRLADMWPFAGSEHYVGDSTRYRDGYERSNRPPDLKGWDLNRWAWKKKKRAWARVPDLTLIAPTSWMAKAVSESLLFRDRRVVTIPTGTDVKTFRPFPRDLARDRLGLPQENPLILFGADRPLHDHRKGFAFIGPAIEHLRYHLPGVNPHIALFGASNPGDSVPKPEIPIHYLGRFADSLSLALAYSAADVLVVPSLEENLANTAIEAMACGTPVVAFNSGGISDLVIHMENGFLAATGDSRELGEGLVWVLKRSLVEPSLSKVARATVTAGFSLESQLSLYLELLDDYKF